MGWGEPRRPPHDPASCPTCAPFLEHPARQRGVDRALRAEPQLVIHQEPTE